MRNSFAALACLALFALPLAAGFSAQAQQAAAVSPQTRNAVKDAWDDECLERQDLREERERIRADHEELVQEHDRLKTQCMDAKGQEASECAEKKDGLRAKKEALRQRIIALHKEVAAEEPNCHSGRGGDIAKGGPWPERQEQPAAPSPVPPQPSEAAR